MQTNLHIEKFTDYRAFLIFHAQDMKQRKPSWSYGAWAQSLGLKTTSSITKIIQGQRDPGEQIIEKMIHYFKFKEKQAQYFKDLVRLAKIKNDPRLSVLLMEKMGKDFPNNSLRLLDDKSFIIISNWYYLALRELVRIKNFSEDADWISEQFIFKVTARDIVKAIEVMLDIKILKRDEKGHLQIVDGRLDTENDIASEAIKRYHEQMLEHAKQAIRRVSVNEREITSTSFLMNSKQIEIAKNMIREFKQNFERMMEDESGDQIYQIQIQLFPLTKKNQSGVSV